MRQILGVIGIIMVLFAVMLVGRDLSTFLQSGKLVVTNILLALQTYAPHLHGQLLAYTNQLPLGHWQIGVIQTITGIPACLPIGLVGVGAIAVGFRMKNYRLS